MKLFFCSGMPRSGSTLLMNILNQNPEFHCTATSGLVEAFCAVRNSWDQWPEMRAMNPEARDAKKLQTLKGMLTGYFSDVAAPCIVDKSRAWISEIELLERILGEPVKILVPVRPMLEILASFEKLWRKIKAAGGRVPQEAQSPALWMTVEGRCTSLLGISEVVGGSFNRLRDAVSRGMAERMYFVEFDELTSRPKDTLNSIYDWLGVKSFVHDFDNVKQTTLEDDTAYGWPGLHTIRPKVEPLESDWHKIIAEHISMENLKYYREQDIYWPRNRRKR